MSFVAQHDFELVDDSAGPSMERATSARLQMSNISKVSRWLLLTRAEL